MDTDGFSSHTLHVTKEEFTLTLKSMKHFRVPSLEGFQCIFFKQYCHIVEMMVKFAFATSYFDLAVTDTLIDLIPKVDSLTTFKYLILINLCNIVYKIVTKILLNHHHPLIVKLISPYNFF